MEETDSDNFDQRELYSPVSSTRKHINELSYKTPVKGFLSINGDYFPPSPQIPESAFKSPQTSAFNTPFIRKNYSRNYNNFLFNLQKKIKNLAKQESPKTTKKSFSINKILTFIIILSFFFIYISPIFRLFSLFLLLYIYIKFQQKKKLNKIFGNNNKTQSQILF